MTLSRLVLVAMVGIAPINSAGCQNFPESVVDSISKNSPDSKSEKSNLINSDLVKPKSKQGKVKPINVSIPLLYKSFQEHIDLQDRIRSVSSKIARHYKLSVDIPQKKRSPRINDLESILNWSVRVDKMGYPKIKTAPFKNQAQYSAIQYKQKGSLHWVLRQATSSEEILIFDSYANGINEKDKILIEGRGPTKELKGYNHAQIYEDRYIRDLQPVLSKNIEQMKQSLKDLEDRYKQIKEIPNLAKSSGPLDKVRPLVKNRLDYIQVINSRNIKYAPIGPLRVFAQENRYRNVIDTYKDKWGACDELGKLALGFFADKPGFECYLIRAQVHGANSGHAYTIIKQPDGKFFWTNNEHVAQKEFSTFRQALKATEPNFAKPKKAEIYSLKVQAGDWINNDGCPAGKWVKIQ